MDLIFDFQILLFYSVNLIYEHSNWPVLLVRHVLMSRRHPDCRTSCILELGGGKNEETMSASKPDPSTYKPIFNDEFLPGSFELHDVLQQGWKASVHRPPESTEVSDSALPDPRNALGIYDGQWITLFLAGPRKWTRSSAPLFHSVLSPAFAVKRKQWHILAPRQAPNKACPLFRSSAEWTVEGSVGTTAGGRVRWQASCHLLSRRQPPTPKRRAADTCLKEKSLPLTFTFVCSLFWKIQGRSSTLRILLDSDMSVT